MSAATASLTVEHPDASVRAVFAAHRTHLFEVIAQHITAGLNPPLGLRDHHSDHSDYNPGHHSYHANVIVQHTDDVMAWALAFGAPGDNDPRVWEHGEPGDRRRVTEAEVRLGDGRQIRFQHTEPADGQSGGDR